MITPRIFPGKSAVAFPVFALASLFNFTVVAAEPTKPNILWISSDDLGPQMGCYGDSYATTPNVDAMAAKGMLFKHAWSCAPVCAAARTTIISGMYPPSTGGEHMRSMVPSPAGKDMFPQFLRAAGYYCTNNNKEEDFNLKKPGQLWDVSSGTAHWKNRAPGQPFFAIFNCLLSHEEKIHTRPHVAIHDPAKVRVPAYHPDVPEIRQEWAQYYDTVTAADAVAGEELAKLAKAGLTEDTIVFYWADHGAGQPRSKRWPCDSGLHVPVVVYFPEKWRHLAPKEYASGAKSDRLISFVDFAPTMLSLADIKPPEWMQGHAFAGKYQEPLQPFIYGFCGRMDERYDLVRTVTDGRYVYLRNYMPHLSQGQNVEAQIHLAWSTTFIWRKLYDAGKCNAAQSIFWQTPKSPEELYDLQSDPDEVKNLANLPEHQAILLKLRQAEQDKARAIRDVGLVPEGDRLAKSVGSSSYDYGQDASKYPFEKVFATAELASMMKPEAVPQLRQAMADGDSTVRYWAAMGMLMRRAPAVKEAKAELEKALTDSATSIRIAAAWALADSGAIEDSEKALAVLAELAPWDKNGIFTSMAVLTAIDNLGVKATGLREAVKTWPATGPFPDAHFEPFVPSLLRSIARRFHVAVNKTAQPAAKAKQPANKTPKPPTEE
jgi:arylsulfatase A-like enzyme